MLTLLIWAGLCSGVALAGQEDPRLDGLFAQLQQVNGHAQAASIEAEIWQIWIAADNSEVENLMAMGVGAMRSGRLGAALFAFDAVVDMAPEFAEGWNKRATLYWMMGEFEESVADIDKTLALEPRHFGALSGLAMIREAQGRIDEAIDALRKAIAVHPHMVNGKQRLRSLDEKLGAPA